MIIRSHHGLPFSAGCSAGGLKPTLHVAYIGSSAHVASRFHHAQEKEPFMDYRRIIPCLDTKDGRLVKGVNFVNLKEVGDPAETRPPTATPAPMNWCCWTSPPRSKAGRRCWTRCRRTVARIRIPLTVGGGIRSIDDMQTLLDLGVSKVSINTAAVRRPELVDEAAEKFGARPRHGRHRHADRTTGCPPGSRWWSAVAPKARDRRRRLGQAGRVARRGRHPADQHGHRRNADRLRPADDPGHCRRGQVADHRFRRGRHAGAPLRGDRRRPRRRGAGRLDCALRHVHDPADERVPGRTGNSRPVVIQARSDRGKKPDSGGGPFGGPQHEEEHQDFLVPASQLLTRTTRSVSIQYIAPPSGGNSTMLPYMYVYQ